MPEKTNLENMLGVERTDKGVRLGGLRYNLTFEQAVNLTAHLVAVLEDKEEEISTVLEQIREQRAREQVEKERNDRAKRRAKP